MDDQGQGEKFTTVSQPGVGGLHTAIDPQDIEDTEMSDCRNVVYQGGYVEPRQGFVQLFAKPSGETMAPNTLARGTNSNGTDSLVAVYGSHFYAWDSLNEQTILLNTSSSTVYQNPPGSSGFQKFWSYETWQGGTGADVMYFSDGVDPTTKWQMGVSYPAMAAASTDGQILMPYPNNFKSGAGTLLAMLSGTPTPLTSFSAVGNVLTITTGASVTSFSITSSNSAQIVANPATGVYTITMTAVPTNDDTFTFDINGTNVVATAVNSIGSNAGNFLIGTLFQSFAALYNLLTNPNANYTDSANYSTPTQTSVALSAPNGVLVGYSTYTTATYNALLFNTTVGYAIPLGTALTMSIAQTSAVPVCSILKCIQIRLWAIGGKGTESTIKWSETVSPENFTVASSNNTDPGTTLWADGHGAITGIVDGGGTIYFFKKDLLAQGQFIYGQSTTTTYIFSLTEFASGTDVGTSNFKKILKNESNADYLTSNNGVVELSNSDQLNISTTVSSSSSVSFSLLSEKINDRLQQPTKIYYSDYTSSLYFSQKGFWAVATAPQTSNSLLLMYDYLFQYWTVFDGWNVQDMIDYTEPNMTPPVGTQMYFLANTDGSVNQCFSGYADGQNPYTAYYVTKRYDLGDASMTKTADIGFLQGLISQGTTLTAQILFNENGASGSQTYYIVGNNNQYVFGNYSAGSMGQFPLGTTPLGSSQEFNPSLPYYRVYPQINSGIQWHNYSWKFSTAAIGSQWAVDKIGILAALDNTHPNTLDLAPGA